MKSFVAILLFVVLLGFLVVLHLADGETLDTPEVAKPTPEAATAPSGTDQEPETDAPKDEAETAETAFPSPTPVPADEPPASEDRVVLREEAIAQPITEDAPRNLLTSKFIWEYGNREWTYTLRTPEALYENYVERARLPFIDYGVFSVYVTDGGQTDQLAPLLDMFAKIKSEEGYSEQEMVELLLRFVQSIPYATDDASKGLNQYTRYPIETLVDLEGDCKDKSILYGALLKGIGIEAVLLILPDEPGHMAVGVTGGDWLGASYAYEGSNYYYAETTGRGWSVGQIPPDYEEREAIIIPLKAGPLVTHEWQSKVMSTGEVEVVVTVRNLGSASAESVGIYAYLDAGDNKAFDQKHSDTLRIPPGATGEYTLYLRARVDTKTRLFVHVLNEGYRVLESTSEWFTP